MPDWILAHVPEWVVAAVASGFFHTILPFAFGGLVTATAYIARRRLPARWAWNLSDPKNAVFILATSAKKDTGVYYRYASGMGQIRAISVLVPLFFRAYRTFDPSNVLLSEEASSALYGNDVIIIGGPKNNKATVAFLNQLQHCPYTMEVNDIIDRWNENKRFQGIAENKKIIEDFGLIIKTKNPFNHKRRCILFLSTHTYGLHAAAVAFAEELTKTRYVWCQNYACLVSSTVSEHFVSKPAVIEFRRFKAK